MACPAYRLRLRIPASSVLHPHRRVIRRAENAMSGWRITFAASSAESLAAAGAGRAGMPECDAGQVAFCHVYGIGLRSGTGPARSGAFVLPPVEEHSSCGRNRARSAEVEPRASAAGGGGKTVISPRAVPVRFLRHERVPCIGTERMIRNRHRHLLTVRQWRYETARRPCTVYVEKYDVCGIIDRQCPCEAR